MYSLELESNLQYPQLESYYSYVEDKLTRQSASRAMLHETDSSEDMIVEVLDFESPEAKARIQAFDSIRQAED